MRCEDLGKLLLRLTVGGLLLFYGIHKIQHGVDWIGGLLASKDLPEVLKYGVFAGEVAAPILLVLGFFTRIGALIVAGNMAFAIYLSHAGDWTRLNPSGGWALQQPMMFGLGALCILLLGAGSLSVDGRRARAAEAA